MLASKASSPLVPSSKDRARAFSKHRCCRPLHLLRRARCPPRLRDRRVVLGPGDDAVAVPVQPRGVLSAARAQVFFVQKRQRPEALLGQAKVRHGAAQGRCLARRSAKASIASASAPVPSHRSSFRLLLVRSSRASRPRPLRSDVVSSPPTMADARSAQPLRRRGTVAGTHASPRPRLRGPRRGAPSPPGRCRRRPPAGSRTAGPAPRADGAGVSEAPRFVRLRVRTRPPRLRLARTRRPPPRRPPPPPCQSRCQTRKVSLTPTESRFCPRPPPWRAPRRGPPLAPRAAGREITRSARTVFRRRGGRIGAVLPLRPGALLRQRLEPPPLAPRRRPPRRPPARGACRSARSTARAPPTTSPSLPRPVRGPRPRPPPPPPAGRPRAGRRLRRRPRRQGLRTFSARGRMISDSPSGCRRPPAAATASGPAPPSPRGRAGGPPTAELRFRMP